MGAFFDEVPAEEIDWIKSQKIYFVGTSPLSESSHINISPKGHSSTFNLIDSNSAWYLDLTGSGNETISHLNENGRITIMFLAFEGPPKIVRLFGIGKVFELDTPEFNNLLPPSDPRRLPGSRSIIWIDMHKVGTSCGYSVPFFDYNEDRPTLLSWAKKREENDIVGNYELGLKSYWTLKNASSMDGMRGLKSVASSNLMAEKKSGALSFDTGRWTFTLGMIWGAVVVLIGSEIFLRMEYWKYVVSFCS